MRFLDYFTSPSSVAARLRYLRVVVVGAFICGILISPRLWFGVGRSFPRAPMFANSPGFFSAHDYVLSLLLLIALLLSGISRRPRLYLFSGAALTLLLVLLDQTRLQPWVYQYVIMLLLLAFARDGKTETNVVAPVFVATQLVVAALYFWSGAQKLSWSFGHEVAPALLESAGIHLPPSYLPLVAVAIAVCEIIIGVGFLIPRTRRASVLLALITHLIVLSVFIATGRNSVVWPWNIAMMAMVVLLFWGSDESPFVYVLRNWRDSSAVHQLPRAVVIICGLLPALSFPGWWGLYLSWSLYSGRTPIAVVHINENMRERLSTNASEKLFATSRGELMLPFYEWSLSELNVPPYPEVRVYRQLARQMCLLADDKQRSELIVRERPALSDGSYKVTRTNCLDLLAQTR